MKIILLLGRSQGGGTEAHAKWLLAALQGAGYETRLYSLFPSHRQSSFTEQFLEVFGLPLAKNRFIHWAKSEQADLVICFGRLANCCGHQIKQQIPNISIIATCRTNRRLPVAYLKTLASADLVLTNSQWARRRVSRIEGVNDENSYTIVNALLRSELGTLSNSPADQRNARLSFGLDPSRPVVSMVAHFVPGKNQEGLIRLVADKQLPAGTQLLFVGEGPRLRNCQRLVTRLALDSEIRFLGTVGQLNDIFRASDLIVSTSLRDSLPNALIEAQAAGVPVVAYDVAGVGEAFLHDQSGILVPAADSHALSSAIEILLGDDELRNGYSNRAREQAVRRFDPNRVLEDYVRHIGSLSRDQ
ncbi:MAG: glycosyltransferase family 4 protein [Verrucomicrobiota bacterium]|nr:glycosyltransferase family 4 protein [Verrucomicrobiota bacterium]